MKPKKSDWPLLAGDLPPAWMIAREPRLAGLADNAVFRAAIWRRNRRPLRAWPLRRKPAPAFLGWLDRQAFIDLLFTGLPARDYACGIWGAAAAKAGAPFLRRYVWTIGTLCLAASILLPFRRLGGEWIYSLYLIMCVSLLAISIELASHAFEPARSLLECAAMIRSLHARIERGLSIRPSLGRRLRAGTIAALDQILIPSMIFVCYAIFFRMAKNGNGRHWLSIDASPTPLARLAGPALACVGALYGWLSGRRSRRRAEAQYGEMVANIDAILKLLADEEALEKVIGIKP